MKTTLISMAICLIIGGYVGWSLHPDKECPENKPNTLIEYRYIDRVDTLRVPKFITKIDTYKVVQLDTFFTETKYIAQIDTTYEDSSLTANIKYVSDIPLSKKSYFDMRFSLRERTITNTVIQTEEVGFFYKRFIPYIGIGMSYNGTTVEPTLQIGFGVRIN